MKVTCVVCRKCGDRIFSRAQHDFHPCSCGNVCVDGGFEYMRYLWKDGEIPKLVEMEIEQTKKELHDDWNFRTNKFGIIKGEENEKEN